MESNDHILPKGYELKSHSRAYTIERKLGQGGFGITYLASFTQRIKAEVSGNLSSFDEEAEQQIKVVVKEFYIRDISSRDGSTAIVTFGSSTGQGRFVDSFKQKMRKEAGFLSRLNHPNIARVSEIFEANNTVYIVMQYIRGESLLDRINRLKKVPVKDAVKYTMQICDALEEVHRNNILHLDVKPGNILLDKQDNAKLIDFGVSKQYNDRNEETSHSVLGKSDGYAPMEQYAESGLAFFSPSTDIYALGATLYCMLVGKKPIPAPARMHTDLAAPIELDPGIPQALSDVVMKAMDIFARKRYQGATEFKTAIDDATRSEKKDNRGKNEDDVTVIDDKIPEGIEINPPRGDTRMDTPEPQVDADWELWKKTKTKNSVAGYEQYLRTFPDGKHKDLARQQIEEIIWENAKTDNTADSLNKYLSEYPNGTYAREARIRLGKISEIEADTDKRKPKTARIAAIVTGVIAALFVLLFLAGVFSPNDTPADNACFGSAENVAFDIAGEKYTYSGDWSPSDTSYYDCVPNGKGKAVFGDGRVYEGDFVFGMRSGKGKMTFRDGSYYEGEVKDNQTTGIGIYHWTDGSYYDGTWKDNKYLDGNIYDKSGVLLTVYKGGKEIE